MADCECLPNCPFFFDKMDDMPAMADIYKRRYCQGDNTECARHAVFRTLGRSHVPSDLFPNDMDYANRVLVGDA